MKAFFLFLSLIVLSGSNTQYCHAANLSQPAQEQAVYAAAVTGVPAVNAQKKKATPDQYYYAGEKYYNAFKYAVAIKFYYYAVKLDKNYLAAWKKLAFCYYKLNNHKNAYSAFKKVLEFDKNDKDAVDFMQYYSNLMEKSRKLKEKREIIDSVWRAAVLPGWGQFYNNQTMKGIIISAGTIISGGLTAYSIVDQNTKYDKYVKTNENQDLAFKEAEAAWNTAMIWTIVVAVIYAGGIVDAAVNYDCPESEMTEVRIKNEGVPIVYASIRW